MFTVQPGMQIVSYLYKIVSVKRRKTLRQPSVIGYEALLHKLLSYLSGLVDQATFS